MRLAWSSTDHQATKASFIRPVVEFVCVALPWHVRPHHLDQPLLAFIREPIPNTHDQGKVRVLNLGCGQGVGKGASI